MRASCGTEGKWVMCGKKEMRSIEAYTRRRRKITKGRGESARRGGREAKTGKQKQRNKMNDVGRRPSTSS